MQKNLFLKSNQDFNKIINPLPFISPSNKLDFQSNIKAALHLNSPPFNDMPLDLISLAFTKNCNPRLHGDKLIQTYKNKYKTCGYQSLEFYGDSIIQVILMDILLDLFGLNITPKKLSTIKSTLLSNKFFNLLMNEKDACKFIITEKPFKIKDNPKLCSNVFEALIGAMYYHLKYNKKIANPILEIKKWIINNTIFIDKLKELVKLL